MAFIDSEQTQNLFNIDASDSLIEEFNIRTILINQQALIVEMQEKMDFIIPNFENEMIAIKQENDILKQSGLRTSSYKAYSQRLKL